MFRHVDVWRKCWCQLQCRIFLWFGNVLKGSLTSPETQFVFRHPRRWNLSRFAFPPAAADGLGSIAIDATQLNMSVTDPTAWATAMNNLGMVPVGLPGQQLVSGKPSLGLEDVCSRAGRLGCLAPRNLSTHKCWAWPGIYAQGVFGRPCAWVSCPRHFALLPNSRSQKKTHMQYLSLMALQHEFCILKR